ncbi:MAG: beta-galactosidase [Clostridia bacterium]|nr:beta-galactosidase [Clostridia bacterium]
MKIRPQGYPLGVMYAPFCRTLYVGMENWEADIRNMRDMGYTCLHGFVEWWRVEKEKGRFDFTEPDYLVELCAKYGITPILNVATQNGVGFYMPRWMQQEYKGRGVVDCDGHGNELESEYVTACLDDPWYQTYAQRFLKAVAEHYAGDSRLGGWVIWGEPLLHKNGKPICYCEHTVARFRKWLGKKYGEIGKLNELWGHEGPSDYTDFSQIQPPTGATRQRGSFASWSDWTTFMEENFASHIKQADTVLKQYGATQPTIIELMCYVGSSGICNDLWELSRCADYVGVSNFLRPDIETDLVMTVANSLAKPLGKPIFIVEANGGPRYPDFDKRTPSPAEIAAEAIQMAGMNADGLMYWCYRPRLSDGEGGSFGMCRNDGKPLPRAYKGGETGKFLEKNCAYYNSAEWKADVAILYSNKIAHLAGADNLSQEFADAQQGALRLFRDAHIPVQLIDEKWIEAGNLAGFKALVLPMSYALEEETARRIAEFAENGGIVICDQGLAQKYLSGVCYMSLPGAGLSALFGVERDDLIYVDGEGQLPPDAMRELPVGSCADVLLPTHAEVVKSAAGIPLITRAQAGAGECWYFANQFFARYRKCGGDAGMRKQIFSVLEIKGVLPIARFDGLDELPTPPVCVSRLASPKGDIYTVLNPGYMPADVDMTLTDTGRVVPLRMPEGAECAAEAAGIRMKLPLGAWGTAVFVLEK